MNEKYMNEAYKEAEIAYLNGDVPIGAVIVKDNEIIARCHNKKHQNKIATEHAEILTINEACKKNQNWRLNDCVMYVTLEPCLMCAGAIIQSRIGKLVYACKNEKFGYVTSINNILDNPKNNHKVEIVDGILQEKSAELLKKFFKEKRH